MGQARGLPVVWSRTYNSRSAHAGPLGHGWTFTYGERLEPMADGGLLYREADGTEHRFNPDGAGGWTPPPGKHLAVTPDGAGHALRSKEGMVSRFAADGRLLSMEGPNGNRVTLAYDSEGHLATVTDAAGRTALIVTTTDGRVTGLTDLAGRTVTYEYEAGDLVAVTDTVGERWIYAYDAGHNLTARADPLGNTDSYAHDALDRCYRHVDPLGHTEVFSYASRGERAVLTDRRGFDTYLEFDERGRALLEVDPLGNAKRSTWDAGNNRTSTVDPRGGVTSRTFDERGNVLAETNPLGETTAYTYDPTYNRVLTTTDPAGHLVENRYDASGNLLETRQTISGESHVESYSYDASGQLTTQTDARGNASTFTWDPVKGTLTAQTDAAGHTTTLTTDTLGRVTAIEDPAGNNASVEWDAKDRITASLGPHGNEVRITFDASGRQTEFSSPGGITKNTYDAAGRLVEVRDALDQIRRKQYDAAGQPVIQTDARGNSTMTTYDALGRIQSRTDPLGSVWTYGWCAEIGGPGSCSGGSCSGGGSAGSFCELTNPLGETTRQEFDVLGRVTKITDPLGRTRHMDFDERGREISRTDALGRTTLFEYDDLNRLVAVVNPEGARTEYTHDLVGNLTNVRNANGSDWPRTYDGLNRVLTRTDPLGHTTTYTYDALGNVTSKQRPNGDLLRYEYDIRRRTAVVLPNGKRETFRYDSRGRRIAMANEDVSIAYEYDVLGRITAEINHSLGKTIGYGYDAAGNRIWMNGPMGRVHYSYDAKNRLVGQNDPVVGTFGYTYDPVGRRSELSYPNGVETTYEYDAAGQLSNLLTFNQAGLIDGYSYTYDAVGNRTTKRDLREDFVHEYRYDDNDRLTNWYQGEDRFEDYIYDPVGNRVGFRGENREVASTFDAADRLLETATTFSDGSQAVAEFTWNQNGSLLSSTAQAQLYRHVWDAQTRLTMREDSVGSVVYRYRPDGVRTSRQSGGITTSYLHAEEDIVAEYEGGVLARYTGHGPGIDEPLVQVDVSEEGGAIDFFHRDALGSVTVTTSLDGNVASTHSYSPFGVADSPLRDGQYGFTGREHERSDLIYSRARYYLADQGRFASVDPAEGSLSMPTSMHLYTYAMNRPTMWTDPSGRQPEQVAEPEVSFGDGDYLWFLIFLSPYLVTLGIIAKVAFSRKISTLALPYIVAIYSWMGIYGYLLHLWFISIGTKARDLIPVLVTFGATVFLLGISYLYQAVAWVNTGGTFISFSVFLYFACSRGMPSGSLVDAFLSREVVICTAVVFYVWAVVRLHRKYPNLPSPGLD